MIPFLSTYAYINLTAKQIYKTWNIALPTFFLFCKSSYNFYHNLRRMVIMFEVFHPCSSFLIGYIDGVTPHTGLPSSNSPAILNSIHNSLLFVSIAYFC